MSRIPVAAWREATAAPSSAPLRPPALVPAITSIRIVARNSSSIWAYSPRVSFSRPSQRARSNSLVTPPIQTARLTPPFITSPSRSSSRSSSPTSARAAVVPRCGAAADAGGVSLI